MNEWLGGRMSERKKRQRKSRAAAEWMARRAEWWGMTDGGAGPFILWEKVSLHTAVLPDAAISTLWKDQRERGEVARKIPLTPPSPVECGSSRLGCLQAPCEWKLYKLSPAGKELHLTLREEPVLPGEHFLHCTSLSLPCRSRSLCSSDRAVVWKS